MQQIKITFKNGDVRYIANSVIDNGYDSSTELKRLLYIQVLNENNEFIGYLNTDNSVNTSGDCYFKSESDCNKEIKRFNIRVPYNTYSFKILK